MKKSLSGSIMLLLATVIWGSAFVSQDIAMAHLPPFSFQAIRSFVAVIGLMPVIAIFDRVGSEKTNFFRGWANKKLWLAGLLCGVPLFLACNLQQLGLAGDTDPGKSGFLTAMYIVIVPIIGIFRRKKPGIMVPVSVVIAVIGLYFLCCKESFTIQTGDILTLCCALMFAVQITFVDIYVQHVNALRLNALQALVCAFLSACVAIYSEQPTLEGVWHCALPIAHTGLLSMGAAYALQILGQKHLEPTIASLIMSLESVFAVLFSWIILGKGLSSGETLGCVLVFTAVILSQIEFKPKKSA